ncbi:DUF6452 family protein [Galbibacter sp. PAP.153]|uniref:DUF6452 family protein n=1 Tax=Galbibacter sp. PAP.153 TaxID=3104623 RepID=UPI0030083300
MRKVLALFFILAIGAAIFSACEKDDICPPETQTTPILTVGFYNLINQDANKTVPSLRVIGINKDSTDRDTLNTFLDRTSKTEIEIPLMTSENSSTFILIYNSKDRIDTLENGDINVVETGNRDTIQFNYSRKERFVSRGCGYAVTITELEAVLNPKYKDTVQNPGEWIRSIFVQDKNLQDQDTVHVKIYH